VVCHKAQWCVTRRSGVCLYTRHSGVSQDIVVCLALYRRHTCLRNTPDTSSRDTLHLFTHNTPDTSLRDTLHLFTHNTLHSSSTHHQEPSQAVKHKLSDARGALKLLRATHVASTATATNCKVPTTTATVTKQNAGGEGAGEIESKEGKGGVDRCSRQCLWKGKSLRHSPALHPCVCECVWGGQERISAHS